MSNPPESSQPFWEVTTTARESQRLWARRTVAERLGPISVFRHLVAQEAEGLCAAVERDLQKPSAEAIGSELLPLAEACRFLESQAERLLSPRRVSLWSRPLWLSGQSDQVIRRPRGLVGIIGTWNYPLFLNGTQIAQAVAAGNAVVWKPSEVCPHSNDALWELLQRSGFPEGLIQRLPNTREAGRQLAEADIDHVVFTGHADTGRKLAETLGRRLVSSTLELSGCDAMYVLEDADAAMAARAAWFGATINAGQTCLAVRRVFIDRRVLTPFLEVLRPLAAAAEPVKLAMPSLPAQTEKVVEDSLAEGATRLVPARETSDPESYIPTVLTDVRPEMPLCREATFAPVMGVIPFERLEDVLPEQHCPYALGASVFTASSARGAGLASQINAGLVTVNDVLAPTAHPGTPFGGRGQSGWGVTQGAEGLIEMTVPQVVSIRSGSWRPHYDPPGETPMTSDATLLAMLRWSHGRTWRLRWQGLRGLLGLAWSVLGGNK